MHSPKQNPSRNLTVCDIENGPNRNSWFAHEKWLDFPLCKRLPEGIPSMSRKSASPKERVVLLPEHRHGGFKDDHVIGEALAAIHPQNHLKNSHRKSDGNHHLFLDGENHHLFLGKSTISMGHFLCRKLVNYQRVQMCRCVAAFMIEKCFSWFQHFRNFGSFLQWRMMNNGYWCIWIWDIPRKNPQFVVISMLANLAWFCFPYKNAKSNYWPIHAMHLSKPRVDQAAGWLLGKSLQEHHDEISI